MVTRKMKPGQWHICRSTNFREDKLIYPVGYRAARSNAPPLLAAPVYLINKFVISFDILMPCAFVHYHLGDLCGGIIFPAYVNVLTEVFAGRHLIAGLRASLVLSCVCSITWEAITPLVFMYGTAGPIDACMYFAGGLIYLASYRAAHKSS